MANRVGGMMWNFSCGEEARCTVVVYGANLVGKTLTVGGLSRVRVKKSIDCCLCLAREVILISQAEITVFC